MHMMQYTAEDILLKETGVTTETMQKTVNELKLTEDEEFKRIHQANIQGTMQRIQQAQAAAATQQQASPQGAP